MAFILRKITNVLFTPPLILSISIAIHFALPSDNLFLLTIRLLIGILALLYIPGYCLVTCFLKKSVLKNFGFYAIFGFLYQLLSVYAIWWVHLFFRPVNFTVLVYLLTLLLVSTLTLYSHKVKGHSLSVRSLKACLGGVDQVLVIILAVFLVMSLYYQQFSSSPHSDGAAYLDLARGIVRDGVFSSNMLFPSWSYQNVEWSTGIHSYFFGISAISLFFTLGNVSLLSAKIMLIFAGSLSIFLVYYLCRELLDQVTARIAVFLVAISPVFLTHVSLVGGPEIPSLLFLLLFMYLTIQFSKYTDSILMPLLAGLSLFVAWYAWRFNFIVIVLGVMPSMFLYLSLKHREFSLGNLLLFSILWVSFLIEYRFSLLLTLTLVGFSFPTVILVAASIVGRFLRKSVVMKVFLVMMLTAYCLFFINHTRSITIMPLIQQAFVNSDVYSANVDTVFGFFNRMLDINAVTEYSRMYLDGLSSTLTQATIFLGIASLVRLRKFKETLLFFSFPFFQWLMWILMVDVGFQPRYIISTSVFWMILAASSITLFMSTVSSLNDTDENYRILLKINKIKRSVNLKSAMGLVAFTLLLINMMILWHPIYSNMKTHILEGWDFSSNFGWDPAIQWINENTQPNDVLMARQGNYWAWFANRKTVMFAPAIFGSVNDAQLISLIREFKVKYLIVDYRLYSEFPELKTLYSLPHSFYGSQITFQSANERGFKTIIYNVTNIAYSNLVKRETLISNCDSDQYWSIFASYGNGTLRIDTSDKIEGNASIKTVCTAKNRKDLIPHAAITFNPLGAWDLSNASILQFWIKAPFEHEGIPVKVATDKNNYFMLYASENNTQDWTQIATPLSNVISVYGKPNLHSIDFLQIYIKNPEPEQTYIFWLDRISVSTQVFVIEK